MENRLKLVPKPEGFDLRTRRADKQESCEAWEPRDALYEASKEMEGKEVTACVVIWRETTKDGTRTVARRAGPIDTTKDLVVTQLGKYMGWVP